MAGIADEIVASGLKNSTNVPDVVSAVQSGAQLAANVQNMQAQRAQIEQKKQELQVAKFDKVGSWFETASKMEDGAAKQAFLKEFIPKGVSALGMGDQIDPTSLKMMYGDPNLATFLRAKVRSGDIAFSDLLTHMKDPEALAKLVPEAQRFGDMQALQGTIQSNIGALDKEDKFRISEGNKLTRTNAMASVRGAMVNNSVDRLNYDIHDKAIKSIDKDKTLTSLLQTKQNLDNAINNFRNGGATSQEFHELQQAVRSNAGIKGSSGVGERADTFAKSMGINADAFRQFLTGDPQSVLESDPALANQIIGVAKLELSNKKKQAEGLIDAKTKANSKFYRTGGRDLKPDYDNYVETYKSQFDSPNLPEEMLSVAGKQIPLSTAREFYKQHPDLLKRRSAEDRKKLGL